jgi:hypothetical protein
MEAKPTLQELVDAIGATQGTDEPWGSYLVRVRSHASQNVVWEVSGIDFDEEREIFYIITGERVIGGQAD